MVIIVVEMCSPLFYASKCFSNRYPTLTPLSIIPVLRDWWHSHPTNNNRSWCQYRPWVSFTKEVPYFGTSITLEHRVRRGQIGFSRLVVPLPKPIDSISQSETQIKSVKSCLFGEARLRGWQTLPYFTALSFQLRAAQSRTALKRNIYKKKQKRQ